MEVSNSTLVAYIDTFKEHKVDPINILKGTSLDYSSIANPKGKISWKDFETITNNTFNQIGEEETLKSLQITGTTNDELSIFTKICSAMLTAEGLYWFFCSFVGKYFYKNLKFEYNKVKKGHIQIIIKMNDGYQCFDNFTKAYATAFEGFPKIIGLKPAKAIIDKTTENPTINLYFTNSIKIWNPFKFFSKVFLSSTNTSKLLSEIEDQRHEQFLLNQKLETLNKELNSSNKLNETLIKAIMHDLNNPLSLISMKTEKLRNDREFFNDRDIQVLHRATENMSNVIKELTSFHIAKKVLCEDSFKVIEAIKDSVSSFQDKSEEKEIDIEIVNNDLDQIQLNGNRTTFVNCILGNIISNAIKFSFNESRVKIETSMSGSDIIISIKDRGTGMNTNSINNFFDNRITDSETGTSGELGLGVGLTQATYFTKKMNGSIEVDSIRYTDDKENHGTEFKLTFPTQNHSLTIQ